VTLQWEDPPEARRANSDTGRFGAELSPIHEETARELRARPNRWARIRTASHPAALAFVRRLRSGEIAAFREGTFEACTRVLDDGTAVYARFVA
jgi:hypothetical protein